MKNNNIKHPIALSFLIFIASSVYLVTRNYEPLWEVTIMFVLLYLSIPTVFIGFLISKSAAPKVGLGLGFAYVTDSVILHFSDPILWGFTWTLPFAPFAFSLGVLTTWIGAVIGDRIRQLLNKENFNIGARAGFLLIYLYPLLIRLYNYFKV